MKNPYNPSTEPASFKFFEDKKKVMSTTIKDDDLDSLEKIIEAIQKNKINYGNDKDYCFFIDEDGTLTFLKRLPDEYRDADFEEEDLKHWPLNEYDGESLFSIYCGEGRGTDITSQLLKIMKIEHGGI